MKVKDLIEKLKEFDPELEVCCNDNEYGLEPSRNVYVETTEYKVHDVFANLVIPKGTTVVVIDT